MLSPLTCTPQSDTSTEISESLYQAPLTIRGKINSKLAEPKVPKSDTKKPVKDHDTIKHCMEQLSKSAVEVAAKISGSSATTPNDQEWQVVRYILTHVPEEKKLMCISDFFRIAEIYKKGGCPRITEET